MRHFTPLAVLLFGATVASAAPPDFAREVRPILSQHCFKCHGPDDKTRKAKFRLDLRSGNLSKERQDELVRRIISDDEFEMMPPPSTKKPLSSAQKAILKQWSSEGGVFHDHWAFIAPKQAEMPKIKQTDWPKSPIDYFILAKLEENGLKPSPSSDKYTLVRRVYLDLIGLPPTPAEADAFVNDKSADAYEKLVDQLLKSPHYGERWARRWLDLARYADTNGYEKDRARTMWLYRDWVIKALNDDLPFDQFTMEQIAGDLLPGATLEQKIATGFHRNTMLNEEGGADPLEYRWHAVNDRVATTGTTWLGLTLQCCQCHNHKFDPIAQREYYALSAFLNNCDEPTIDVPSPKIEAERRAQEKQNAEREANLWRLFSPDPLADSSDKRSPAELQTAYRDARFRAWLDIERKKAVNWTVLKPTSANGNIPLLTIEPDGTVFVSGDKSKSDVYDLTFATDHKDITAIRIEALPDDRLPARGPGRVSYEGPFGDFFLCEVTLTNDGKRQKWGQVSADYFAGNDRPEFAADGEPMTGWSINGGQGRPHELVLNLAEPIRQPGKLALSMLCEKYYAAGLGKFRVSVTSDALKSEARGIPNELAPLLRKPMASLTLCEWASLWNQFIATAAELKPQRDEIQRLRNSLPRHPTALVMEERPANYTRPTFIHKRGEFTQPTEPVQPGVPAWMPSLTKGAKPDRLMFARWLVSPENPLTARVTVNRAWAAFFGRGIVRTTEDFGYQGEPPTHPELLDWLAVQFMLDGWSMKKLHKTIVMSATYRQESGVKSQESVVRGQEIDPTNRWLWHGPRLRLEAELVRDSALKVSGLLSPKIGGPSVYPPQPASVTLEGAYGGINWTASSGEDRYRRGLYTFSKRTAPFAMFTTFDAPSGEACVARREVSNTPLQALTLLNDAVFIESAQALARQLAKVPGSPQDKARELWRRCLTRPPKVDELALVVKFYETQKKRLSDKSSELAELGGEADTVRAIIDRAAWTAAARAVLNLDEMVTRE